MVQVFFLHSNHPKHELENRMFQHEKRCKTELNPFHSVTNSKHLFAVPSNGLPMAIHLPHILTIMH